MDSLSGGFVFGVGGSGLITPHIGGTPVQSGANTPARLQNAVQMNIGTVYDGQMKDGSKIDT